MVPPFLVGSTEEVPGQPESQGGFPGGGGFIAWPARGRKSKVKGKEGGGDGVGAR